MAMRKSALDQMIMERRPIICKNCGGKLFYQGSGEYKCEDCNEEQLDDFGVVKRYLEEHGPTAAPIIHEDTGIPYEVLDLFLKNGRLEIPEGSKYYIKCEKCGCALRFGRYCHSCTKDLAGEIRGAMFEQMGEKPKNEPKKEEGKMHFLNLNWD